MCGTHVPGRHQLGTLHYLGEDGEAGSSSDDSSSDDSTSDDSESYITEESDCSDSTLPSPLEHLRDEAEINDGEEAIHVFEESTLDNDHNEYPSCSNNSSETSLLYEVSIFC